MNAEGLSNAERHGEKKGLLLGICEARAASNTAMYGDVDYDGTSELNVWV